jgi:methylglutaconyl-CoA hydratase
MSTYTFIECNAENGILRINLNRPQKHNALNSTMVKELIHAMSLVAEDPRVRVVLLSGNGESFCAGGDINFFEEVHGSPDFLEFGAFLQELLFEMVHCRVPVISAVKGKVYGGALGILAASDIVVSSEDARFCFSETKIGMAPAAILPFINKRIGTTQTRYLTLTAMVFDAGKALLAGLVNKTAPPELLEKTVDDIIREILLCSPEATYITKKLINAIDNRNVLIDSASYSIHFYEDLNKSSFVAEGLRAFREKRKPSWVEST